MSRRGRAAMADGWWSLVSPFYDRAVALVGWHRALAELVADLGPGRVLDVGCGPAYLAPLVAARGATYVGVDSSARMAARARRRAAGAAGTSGTVGTSSTSSTSGTSSTSSTSGTVVRADATRLPFDDGTFDVVIAAAVIGLLSAGERRAALREMARVTRGDIRLLEPIRLPGNASHPLRVRAVALAPGGPIELEELTGLGLTPVHLGPRFLGTYSLVRAVRVDTPTGS